MKIITFMKIQLLNNKPYDKEKTEEGVIDFVKLDASKQFPVVILPNTDIYNNFPNNFLFLIILFCFATP